MSGTTAAAAQRLLSDLFKPNPDKAACVEWSVYEPLLRDHVASGKGTLPADFLAGWSHLRRIDVTPLARVGVTCIESGFLRGCSSLTTISGLEVLAESVEDVDMTDFLEGCTNLEISQSLLVTSTKFSVTPLGSATMTWLHEQPPRCVRTSEFNLSPSLRAFIAVALVVAAAACVMGAGLLADGGPQYPSPGCSCLSQQALSDDGTRGEVHPVVDALRVVRSKQQRSQLQPVLITTEKSESAFVAELRQRLVSNFGPCVTMNVIPLQTLAQRGKHHIMEAWSLALQNATRAKTGASCHVIVVHLDFVGSEGSAKELLAETSVQVLNSAKELVEDNSIRGEPILMNSGGAPLQQGVIVFATSLTVDEIKHVSGVQYRVLHVMMH